MWAMQRIGCLWCAFFLHAELSGSFAERKHLLQFSERKNKEQFMSYSLLSPAFYLPWFMPRRTNSFQLHHLVSSQIWRPRNGLRDQGFYRCQCLGTRVKKKKKRWKINSAVRENGVIREKSHSGETIALLQHRCSKNQSWSIQFILAENV